jgi:hypothetical protein
LQLRQLAAAAVKQTVLLAQQAGQAAAAQVMPVQAVQAHRVKEVMVVRVAELMAAVAVEHRLWGLRAARQAGKEVQDQHHLLPVLLLLIVAAVVVVGVLRQAVLGAAVRGEQDLRLAQPVRQTQAVVVEVAVLTPTLRAQPAVQVLSSYPFQLQNTPAQRQVHQQLQLAVQTQY